VTRCTAMEFRKEAIIRPAVPGRDASDEPPSRDSLAEKMMDFLDGRTHGEEVLHALYDQVLDEPIPERMRALFKEK
jgi:Anti-sigma factor NepR